MVSEREIFNLTGPTHLTAVDWKNTHHRRSVAASLVKGVCILERDRQERRKGAQALAPPWWDSFHFRLLRVLVDDTDGSFFGAIYEFKFSHSYKYFLQNPPRYVIAFRGTINKPQSRCQDLKLDFKLIRNKLEESSRFQIAMENVHHMVSVAGTRNVWIAGHSLGSAIALLTGKNMVKMGSHTETYLFNPPFISAPIERIKSERLKHGIRYTKSVIKAKVAGAVKSCRDSSRQDDTFDTMSTWIPNLFVNPSDPICSEYVGYFLHREKMVKIGAGEIERLAMKHSIGSLLSNIRGRDSEPLHLLPSAHLTINRSSCLKFKEAHGIHQWWKSDNHLEFKLHKFE